MRLICKCCDFKSRNPWNLTIFYFKKYFSNSQVDVFKIKIKIGMMCGLEKKRSSFFKKVLANKKRILYTRPKKTFKIQINDEIINFY